MPWAKSPPRTRPSSVISPMSDPSFTRPCDGAHVTPFTAVNFCDAFGSSRGLMPLPTQYSPIVDRPRMERFTHASSIAGSSVQCAQTVSANRSPAAEAAPPGVAAVPDPSDSAYHDIVRLTARICGADFASLTIGGEAAVWCSPATALPASAVPHPDPFHEYVARTGDPFEVADAALDRALRWLRGGRLEHPVLRRVCAAHRLGREHRNSGRVWDRRRGADRGMRDSLDAGGTTGVRAGGTSQPARTNRLFCRMRCPDPLMAPSNAAAAMTNARCCRAPRSPSTTP